VTAILLIEDNRDYAATLGTNLSREGFDVLAAANGVEGLEMGAAVDVVGVGEGTGVRCDRPQRRRRGAHPIAVGPGAGGLRRRRRRVSHVERSQGKEARAGACAVSRRCRKMWHVRGSDWCGTCPAIVILAASTLKSDRSDSSSDPENPLSVLEERRPTTQGTWRTWLRRSRATTKFIPLRTRVGSRPQPGTPPRSSAHSSPAVLTADR
jgi:hypothetical protein